MIEFSIFLPVRNGWPHVKQCVESIFSQSYQYFRLNVLDNQSTDGTLEWLRTLEDPRLCLSTSPVPLGIESSWGRILSVGKREFMTIIGHDDLLGVEFLATVKRLIEKYPDAGLYQVGARYINAVGAVIRECDRVAEKETAAEYLRKRLGFRRDVFGSGYVMRSLDYDGIGGIPKFERLFFADDALWMSLIRNSYKAADPDVLCSIRIHARSESASIPSAWSSIMRGLNQFVEFLRQSSENDRQVREVMERFLPAFLLRYHRNIYIYALVEASQRRERVSAATIDAIQSSLHDAAPHLGPRLRSSMKVRAIETLNKARLQGQLVALWRMYSELKSRAR